jgi:hypothetical protein
MGSLSQAAETFNDGRKLDEADRYMNSKCGKYQLRANDITSASGTIAMFTRQEGSPEWHLHEVSLVYWFFRYKIPKLFFVFEIRLCKNGEEVPR